MPSMFFYHGTSYARAHDVSGRYRKSEVWGESDGSCCHQRRRGSLWIVHLVFSDFFSDRLHDPFPSDKCTRSDSHRYEDDDPPGNIVSRYREIFYIFIDTCDIYATISSCMGTRDERNYFEWRKEFVALLDTEDALSYSDFICSIPCIFRSEVREGSDIFFCFFEEDLILPWEIWYIDMRNHSFYSSDIFTKCLSVHIWIDRERSWKESDEYKCRDTDSLLSVIFSVHEAHETWWHDEDGPHAEGRMVPWPAWRLEVLSFFQDEMGNVYQTERERKSDYWRNEKSFDYLECFCPVRDHESIIWHKCECDTYSKDRSDECMRARNRESKPPCT